MKSVFNYLPAVFYFLYLIQYADQFNQIENFALNTKNGNYKVFKY